MKKSVVYSILALALYVGVVIGMGLIWDLFWVVPDRVKTMYWALKCIVTGLVLLFAFVGLFTKRDSGIGGMQVMFSICLTLLPLLCKVIGLIPVAGFYIAIIVSFLTLAFYLGVMLVLGFNDHGKGNKKI